MGRISARVPPGQQSHSGTALWESAGTRIEVVSRECWAEKASRHKRVQNLWQQRRLKLSLLLFKWVDSFYFELTGSSSRGRAAEVDHWVGGEFLTATRTQTLHSELSVGWPPHPGSAACFKERFSKCMLQAGDIICVGSHPGRGSLM